MPLKEALILMNNEGVTSLAVVDNQYNVVGNISNADVKVSLLEDNVAVPTSTNNIAASHKVKLSTLTRKYLHTFYLRNSFHSRHE